MEIKIFSIPTVGGEEENDNMNAFLRGHKVLTIEQQLVQTPNTAYWSFCIQYIKNQIQNKKSTIKRRVDYKTILDEKTFEKFSKLRAKRKAIALEDAIPAYLVFTDEELAEIAKLEEVNNKTLKMINGIGDKKTEKYGIRIIETLNDTDNEA